LASLHILTRTRIETGKGARTLRDMFPVNKQLLAKAAQESSSQTQLLRKEVDGIEKDPNTPMPTDEVSDKIENMSIQRHREIYRDSFFSTATDRILFGSLRPVFTHESMWRKLYRIPSDALTVIKGVEPIPGKKGGSWLRAEYSAGLCRDFLGHRADIFTLLLLSTDNLSLFEHLESLQPDAGYCDVHLPDPFTEQFQFLRDWSRLRDAASRYALYEERDQAGGFRAIHLRIADTLIDIERDPDSSGMSMRKPMLQGRSLPPRKALAKIGRDEDLTVVTTRIPVWLKDTLETKAKEKGEQLGTYIRETLQSQYD